MIWEAGRMKQDPASSRVEFDREDNYFSGAFLFILILRQTIPFY